MRKKLTLKIIKDKLKIINPSIEIISTEYIGSMRNLSCKCRIDSYEWKASWNGLSHGNGCPKCGGRPNLNLEKIKEKLININPNIEVLSDKYINANSKLKLKCKVDSYEWEATWGSLSSNHGCPKCKARKLSIRIKKRTGAVHPNWKGGVTPLSDYLRNHILEWKQDSFKKYNWKCDITGEHNTVLEIHHPLNFSDMLQETLTELKLPIYPLIGMYTDIELKSIEDECTVIHAKYGLGICLSKTEHKLFHQINGGNNNTLKQYQQFKTMRLQQINASNKAS